MSYAITGGAGKADTEAARLYYDGERGKLGIELLEEYDKSDRSQRKVSKENSGISVNAAALFRYYGYEIGKKRSAPIQFEQGMIVVDVNDVPRRGLSGESLGSDERWMD
ncbi:MAG: hypothetical protein FKY71_04660 [Spiribacter salinus]|uniref:Uncharacterized protein n=1 Tax=Spiribacter salinus TaxID=1335746 RepID=A0A540VVN3_9GAMM|nr:MAG: hypothetical protein FKY71_04660 [Spiribacter salinus]